VWKTYSNRGFPESGQADSCRSASLSKNSQSGIGRPELFLYIPRFPKPTKEKAL